VPDGITVERFEGNARDGFEAVLATINKDLKKKKQLTLRVDPSLEEALSKRQTRYYATSYRVEELLNFLCGGVCEWHFEEQEEGRTLALSPPPPAAAS
jgi:lipid II:glycine glycyltransferase (peptidoglycan interpeptide bridge formation enzyme)